MASPKPNPPTPPTVRMELARVLIQELKDSPIIELREVAPVSDDNDTDPEGTRAGTVSQVEHGRSLPIVIGVPEAQAIERGLKGITVKRPQTHDLLANVIKALGGVLESITINDLVDGTFYAQLNIRVATTDKPRLVAVDCRPSDAIALGITGGVPIYVAVHVLEQARADEPPAPPTEEE